jgi:hypothetical protein
MTPICPTCLTRLIGPCWDPGDECPDCALETSERAIQLQNDAAELARKDEVGE